MSARSLYYDPADGRPDSGLVPFEWVSPQSVLGGFALVPGPLSLARSLAGVAAAGPVVFVAGGASAAGPTARVESRAW